MCDGRADSGRTIVRLLLCAGVGLILLAAFLFGNHFFQKYQTAEECRAILEELVRILPVQAEAVSAEMHEDGEDPAVLEVRGVSCVGILEAPFLERSWPVAGRFEDGAHIPSLAEQEEGASGILIEDAGKGSVFDCFTPGDEGETVRFTDVYGCVRTYVIADVLEGEETNTDGSELIIRTRDPLNGEVIHICCRQE